MTSQELIQKVVVARSEEGNDELQKRLARLGIPATAIETIRFEEPSDWSRVDKVINGISKFHWVVFTSPRAVAVFRARLIKLGFQSRNWPKIAAVGSKTASALAKAGIKTDFVPREYLTSALAEGLPLEEGNKVLLFRADIGEKSLVSLLEKRGFDVTGVVAYRTRPARGKIDPKLVMDARLIAFASPSEVRGFRSRLDMDDFRKVAEQATAACIGPVTAQAAQAAGFRSVVSVREHTVDALAVKIRELAVHA